MPNFMLHRKLFLSYVLLALLPTVILGIYLSSSVKSVILSRTLKDAVKSVEGIRSDFSHSLNVPIDVSTQLYLNQNFVRLIETQYNTTWDVVSSYFLFRDFEGLLEIYSNQIGDMRIYAKNDTILEGWYLNKITESVADEDWYQLAMAHPGRVVWCPTINPNVFTGDRRRYSLVRRANSRDMQAVLLIDLNTAYLDSLLKSEQYDIAILDAQGNVISANRAAAQNSLHYTFDAYPLGSDVSIHDGESDDGPCKVILKDMSVDGVNGQFRIVASFLLSDIMHESNMLLTRFAAVSAVCLLLIIGLVLLFSRNLRRRATILQREMEQVSKGDFALVSSITGRDEISMLSQSLNVMAKNLKQLVEENYEANLQKQQLLAKNNAIKLEVLKNQINPHFLFNTLESLRMEARIHNEFTLSDIIRRLGGLLRKSIQAGNEEIPLQEEIKLVEDYLCIQAFRHGNRIQYALCISDEACGVRVLPFLVQPLVENAIVHGLEHSEQPGMIRINALCEGTDLFIEVIDNGVGMTPERLAQVRASLDEDASDLHIGVRNVHLRIRIRYGAPYGLSIEHEPGVHTKVCLRIPKGGEGTV